MPGFKSVTLPILFKVAEGAAGLGEGDGRTCAERASKAIADGVNILILSDRGIDRENARRSPRCWPSPACIII